MADNLKATFSKLEFICLFFAFFWICIKFWTFGNKNESDSSSISAVTNAQQRVSLSALYRFSQKNSTLVKI